MENNIEELVKDVVDELEAKFEMLEEPEDCTDCDFEIDCPLKQEMEELRAMWMWYKAFFGA